MNPSVYEYSTSTDQVPAPTNTATEAVSVSSSPSVAADVAAAAAAAAAAVAAVTDTGKGNSLRHGPSKMATSTTTAGKLSKKGDFSSASSRGTDPSDISSAAPISLTMPLKSAPGYSSPSHPRKVRPISPTPPLKAVAMSRHFPRSASSTSPMRRSAGSATFTGTTTNASFATNAANPTTVNPKSDRSHHRRRALRRHKNNNAPGSSEDLKSLRISASTPSLSRSHHLGSNSNHSTGGGGSKFRNAGFTQQQQQQQHYHHTGTSMGLGGGGSGHKRRNQQPRLPALQRNSSHSSSGSGGSSHSHSSSSGLRRQMRRNHNPELSPNNSNHHQHNDLRRGKKVMSATNLSTMGSRPAAPSQNSTHHHLLHPTSSSQQQQQQKNLHHHHQKLDKKSLRIRSMLAAPPTSKTALHTALHLNHHASASSNSITMTSAKSFTMPLKGGGGGGGGGARLPSSSSLHRLRLGGNFPSSSGMANSSFGAISQIQQHHLSNKNYIYGSVGSLSATSSANSSTCSLRGVLSTSPGSVSGGHLLSGSRSPSSAASYASGTAGASTAGGGTGGGTGPNAVMQLAQRSNASTVKSIISELSHVCEQAQHEKEDEEARMLDTEQNDPVSSSTMYEADAAASDMPVPTIPIPVQQVAMLAQWASVDAYYKVLISKYNGIPAIIDAMKVFIQSPDLQAHGCNALKHLNNKIKIGQSGGIRAIVSAIQTHSSNISVMSEGLQALQAQAPTIFAQRQNRPTPGLSTTTATATSVAAGNVQSTTNDMTIVNSINNEEDLAEIFAPLPALLEEAKEMYLTKPGREACLFLQQVLPTLVPELTSQIHNHNNGMLASAAKSPSSSSSSPFAATSAASLSAISKQLRHQAAGPLAEMATLMTSTIAALPPSGGAPPRISLNTTGENGTQAGRNSLLGTTLTINEKINGSDNGSGAAAAGGIDGTIVEFDGDDHLTPTTDTATTTDTTTTIHQPALTSVATLNAYAGSRPASSCSTLPVSPEEVGEDDDDDNDENHEEYDDQEKNA